MGARGPAPKPTAILKRRGSWRGTYSNKKEPAPRGVSSTKDLPAPAWLVGAGRKKYGELVTLLAALRVLTLADGEALARYCKLQQRWCQAEAWLDENGPVIIILDEEGNPHSRLAPQARLASTLAEQLLRLEQQYGLTPSARSRVSAVETQEESGKGRFFA